MSLSSCYLEMWNYTEAQKCLNEANHIAEEKNPNIFFRLGQSILYNKFSREENWAEVMSYFSKAKRLLIKNKIEDKLDQLISHEMTKLSRVISNYEEQVKERNQSKSLILIIQRAIRTNCL